MKGIWKPCTHSTAKQQYVQYKAANELVPKPYTNSAAPSGVWTSYHKHMNTALNSTIKQYQNYKQTAPRSMRQSFHNHIKTVPHSRFQKNIGPYHKGTRHHVGTITHTAFVVPNCICKTLGHLPKPYQTTMPSITKISVSFIGGGNMMSHRL